MKSNFNYPWNTIFLQKSAAWIVSLSLENILKLMRKVLTLNVQQPRLWKSNTYHFTNRHSTTTGPLSSVFVLLHIQQCHFEECNYLAYPLGEGAGEFRAGGGKKGKELFDLNNCLVSYLWKWVFFRVLALLLFFFFALFLSGNQMSLLKEITVHVSADQSTRRSPEPKDKLNTEKRP